MPVQFATEHHPGPAPAVIMIHGWTCRKSDWHAQIDHLKGRHEILAIDLPGHGESGSNGREDWSMARFAQDVIDALELVSSDSIILMGHSMGGTVALEAAAKAPDRVQGVILADTFLINYGALDQATIDGFYQPFSDDFKGAMGELVENTSGPQSTDDLKKKLKSGMGNADPAWALKAWWELLNWDPQPAFESIRAPIHAINCPLIPDTTRERLAGHMQDTVLPDTGHFLNQEDPDAFNQALDRVIPAMTGKN